MHDIKSRLTCAVDVFADVLSKLLKTFVIDHKDSATKTPNVALANILRQNKGLDKKLLESFKHPDNKKKIYDCTSPSDPLPFNVCIDISSLDISLQYQILTRVEGFLTYQEKSIQCKDPAHQSCCKACDHQCNCHKKCKKVDNGKHLCTNCRNTQRDCKGKSGCCHACEKCEKCTMNLPTENQCPSYKLKKSVDMIQNFRNLVAHMTDKDCENFENRHLKEPFSNFPDYEDWKSFSDCIINVIFENIITFMQNFKNTLSLKKCEKYKNALLKTLRDPDVKELLRQHEVKLQNLREMEKRVSSTEAKVEIIWNNKIQTGDEHVQRLEFKRLDGNACLLKLPVQLNITQVSVSENKGDWKELEDHSFEFDDLHLFVKMKFKDSNSYSFKVIGDRMDIDQQNEEFCSENAMYESKVVFCQYSVYGVGFICYGNCLSSSSHNIIKNIEELGLQTPNKVEQEVYSSAGPSSKIVTKEDWYETCLKFLNRNYGKSCKETIQLPVDCVQDTFKSKFVNVFKDWCCSYQNAEEMGGMVISSYDAHKHAKFLGYNMKDVVKKLKLMPDNNFENRLLVYHPSFHLILNVRVLTEGGTIQLQDAMCVSCDDIKLEMLIHKDILFHSDIVLLTLLVVPNLDQLADRARFSTVTSYDMLLISYEDLSNLDSFTQKWKRSIRNHVKKMRKDHQLNTKGKIETFS